MVDDDLDPPEEIDAAEFVPEQNDHHHHGGKEQDSQDEPAFFNARYPGHDHKDEQIGETHAEVARSHRDQAEHHQGMACDLHDRGNGADVMPPALDAAALPGQKQDKGEFDDLRGLEFKGDAGDGEPAAVARAVVHADGRAGEEHKADVEGQQELPGLFRKKLHIHRGHHNIDQYAQHDGNGLDRHEAGAFRIAGGAVNEHQSKAAGGQTEGEQHKIPLAEKFFEGVGKPGQRKRPPFQIRPVRNPGSFHWESSGERLLSYHLFGET